MRLLGGFSRFAFLFLLVSALVLAACGPSGSTGGQTDATSVTVSPAFLSFDGTETAVVTVTANGRWTLASNVSWLKVDRSSGASGTSRVTVTVDRAGLAAQQYAAELTFSGAGELKTVTVSMRFPTVSGVVTNDEGLVATSASAGRDAAAAAAPGAVIPGEYIVVLDTGMARVLEAGVSAASFETVQPSMATLSAMSAGLAADFGFTSQGVQNRELAFMVAKGLSEEEAARLAADGRVKSVTPNVWIEVPPVTPAAIDVGYAFGYQWHYEDIQLSNAWNITQGAEDVVVAVIDTGFAYWHPDLAPNYLGGYDFAYDVADPGAYSECADHGTHVAGTVAATAITVEPYTSGVAPNVGLRLIRTGRDDAGCRMPTDAVISGVLYAAGYKVGNAPQVAPVDVINLSLGGPAYDPAFADAIALAIDRGVTVVAATGNESTTPVAYPAGYPSVIGVGATDYREQRASYSNYGQEVDVVAPGGNMNVDLNGDGFADGVLSLAWDRTENVPYYLFMDGTSMASPHVAGVAALLRSVNPDLSPLNVELILEVTAKDLGIAGPDTWYGWGLVDAGAAVSLARALEAAPSFSDVIVRLSSGATVVKQTTASGSGAFDLGQVAAGTYRLEAGTDLDGDGRIDDFGELYVSLPVTVTYEGDLVAGLNLELGLR